MIINLTTLKFLAHRTALSHSVNGALVAITPQGSIVLVSELYGGRTSDRHIVRDCGFLNYINPHDEIVADRGLGVKEEFILEGATIVIPPASKGSSQMTSKNVQRTKKVANVMLGDIENKEICFVNSSDGHLSLDLCIVV